MVSVFSSKVHVFGVRVETYLYLSFFHLSCSLLSCYLLLIKIVLDIFPLTGPDALALVFRVFWCGPIMRTRGIGPGWFYLFVCPAAQFPISGLFFRISMSSLIPVSVFVGGLFLDMVHGL